MSRCAFFSMLRYQIGWCVLYVAVRAHKQPNNSSLFPLTLAFFLTDANTQRRL